MILNILQKFAATVIGKNVTKIDCHSIRTRRFSIWEGPLKLLAFYLFTVIVAEWHSNRYHYT